MPESPAKAIKLKKVLTVANVQNQTIQRIPFEGEWYEAFKQPQDRGVWFIWGSSGGGKSTFTMKLAKELARTEKTLYNVLEEEPSDSDYIERTELCGMNEVEDNFFTQSYDHEQLLEYLDKKGSPKVVVIDSIIYLTKRFEDYLNLKNRYKDKLIIITGHAQGKDPRSEFEKSVMFDAKMKIYIEGYAAYCKGRTIGPNGGIFTIWKEGFEKLNGAGALNN
ncbi:MAG: hypothetical protein JJE55_08060 [Flavobacteriaceae bacterium]|nr:hypothetical protein [Flavobacteriaceae bacterium]